MLSERFAGHKLLNVLLLYDERATEGRRKAGRKRNAPNRFVVPTIGQQGKKSFGGSPMYPSLMLAATDEGVKQRFVTINELNVGNEIQFYGRCGSSICLYGMGMETLPQSCFNADPPRKCCLKPRFDPHVRGEIVWSKPMYRTKKHRCCGLRLWLPAVWKLLSLRFRKPLQPSES